MTALSCPSAREVNKLHFHPLLLREQCWLPRCLPALSEEATRKTQKPAWSTAVLGFLYESQHKPSPSPSPPLGFLGTIHLYGIPCSFWRKSHSLPEAILLPSWFSPPLPSHNSWTIPLSRCLLVMDILLSPFTQLREIKPSGGLFALTEHWSSCQFRWQVERQFISLLMALLVRLQECNLSVHHWKLLSPLSFGIRSSQGSTRNDDFHAFITLTKLLAVSDGIFQSELWVMPFTAHSSSSQVS